MNLRSWLLLTLIGSLLRLPVSGNDPSRVPATSRSPIYRAEKQLDSTPPTPEALAAAADAAAQWTQKRLRAAYERAGTKNPKWNDAVLAVLDDVARLRAGSGKVDLGQLRTKVRKVAEQDCTDPLLRYFNLRYGRPLILRDELPNEYRSVSLALRESDYDAIEKFWATHRTASFLKERAGTNRSVEVDELRTESYRWLIQALTDTSMPPEEVVAMTREFMEVVQGNSATYRQVWAQIDPVLGQFWGDRWSVLQLRGRVHLTLAWKARGNQTADKVTEEGWKGFAQELKTAQELLTRSWQLSPDTETARQMINVELGQGEGRERMELWFNRAMALDPTNYGACVDKLWYLMPRWHGDHPELIRFGRQCLDHPTWKGEVPLTLVRAHEYVASDLPRSKRPAYWQTPAVWSDVRKSLERFFELNPKDVSWRHTYAKHAWQARDWEELNRQIPLLGEINYTYFGGKPEFERMLAEAKAREGTGPK